MKKLRSLFSWRIISLVLLTGIVVATSCTKEFDKINTNPSAIARPGPAELPFLFSKAQSTATQNMWNYQVSQNLFADQYAQYFGCRATYFNSDRGVVRMDWVYAAFDPMYTDVVPQLQTIMSTYDPSSVDPDGLPSLFKNFTTAESSIASILWVHAFHQVTDYWGPIPYFKAGLAIKSVPYDAQDVIYDDFFQRLASAVAVLKTKAGTNAFGAFDLIYGGDVNHWIKFANTLRLRLAMRISAVDPARAKTEAEAAVADGVMTSIVGDDDAYIKRSNKGGDGNGLSIMSPWGEFRMSASMESVLTGTSDPRLGEYFLPALLTDTYEGLRNGLSVAQLGGAANGQDALSHVGLRFSDFDVVPNPDYLEYAISGASTVAGKDSIVFTGSADAKAGDYLSGAGIPKVTSIVKLYPATGTPTSAKISSKALVSGSGITLAMSRNNKLKTVVNPGLGLELHSNVMHATEAYFLRAEGALNGWNMKDNAQNLYNLGIDASMAQWGISDAAAIASFKVGGTTAVSPDDAAQTTVNQPYVLGAASPAANSVPVLYNSGNPVIAREQIALQKWVALFPNGMEAWADYRRQRLPHLYPFANTENTDINLSDPHSYMRRITFLTQESNRNAEGVAVGVSKLEGPDKVTTPLWWDKNP